MFTIGAFVIAILIIVSVHEYGHYIVGRWCGIHAEVFSIGFGQVLWSRVDKHGTKWQIAALPLGGYVKFMGDANAASGKDEAAVAAMSEAEKRSSIHTAPLWARAATVAAGPIFNFVLSILIFSAIIGWRGFAADPLTIAKILPTPFEQNLQAGDEVLAIAGVPTPSLENFDDYITTLPAEAELDYTILRDGQELNVIGPYPYPAIVSSITPRSAASDADIEVGDVITAANGTAIATFSELRDLVGNSDGSPVVLSLWRNGQDLEQTLTPKRMDLPLSDGGFETRWLVGITGGMVFEPETTSPGIFEAISYGAQQMVFIITSSISGLYHMITGAISSCNLSGPIGIAETSGTAASQGVMSFIWFVAVLSTAVGMLNLFPIPVLDGGHLVFQAYEAIVGRPPKDQTVRVLMTVGLTCILGLMVFALTNDLFCP